jgi:hypothetical protein
MTARAIVDALTGDHHFTQAGFQMLPLPSNRRGSAEPALTELGYVNAA